MVKDESTYVREDDNVDRLLEDIHRTADMLKSLFDDLAQHTDRLEAEIKTPPKSKEVRRDRGQ